MAEALEERGKRKEGRGKKVSNGIMMPFLRWQAVYTALFVVRNVKSFAPFHIKTHIGECLVRSIFDFNGLVYRQLPNYLTHRLQRVQLGAASSS